MNIDIGQKLKQLRKQKGLSQEQVADFLHISQSAYARIENGESHSWAYHIRKICEIFDITPEELVREGKSVYQIQMNDEKNLESMCGKQQLADKLIEQYEQTIKSLKEQIEIYKKMIDEKEKPMAS